MSVRARPLVVALSVIALCGTFVAGAPLAQALVCGTNCDVTYHGGPLETASRNVAVRWDARVPDATIAAAGALLTAVNGSGYLAKLSEYNVPSYSLTNTATYLGARTTSAAEQSVPFTVTDAQVQSQLQTDINSGLLPAPDANTNYFMFFPAGATITFGGGGSLSTFCTYHNTFALDSTTVKYSVLPDYNQTAAIPGCGATASDALDNFVSNTLIDMITDPDGGVSNLGWYDNTGTTGEIGGPCYENALTSVSDIPVSSWWSNSAVACVGGNAEVHITDPPPARTSATSASFVFADTDPFGRSPTFVCAVDATPAKTCEPSQPVGFTGLSVGSHTFTVTGSDGAQSVGTASATTTVVAAPSAPSLRPLKRRATTAAAITLSYLRSGASTYDLRERVTNWHGRASAWHSPAGWTNLQSTSHRAGLTPGNDYCFEVRATVGGVSSNWSTPRCIASPLDDRALHATTSGWQRLSGPAGSFYRRTVSVSSTHHATLRLGSIAHARIALVVTRCRGCGTITVDRGKRVWRTISTSSRRTRHKSVILLPNIGNKATVSIRVASRGKTVDIDGLAVIYHAG